MDIILIPLFSVLHTALRYYTWIVLLGGLFNQLVIFNVINPYNSAVRLVREIFFRLTDPFYVPSVLYPPPLRRIRLVSNGPLFLLR